MGIDRVPPPGGLTSAFGSGAPAPLPQAFQQLQTDQGQLKKDIQALKEAYNNYEQSGSYYGPAYDQVNACIKNMMQDVSNVGKDIGNLLQQVPAKDLDLSTPIGKAIFDIETVYSTIQKYISVAGLPSWCPGTIALNVVIDAIDTANSSMFGGLDAFQKAWSSYTETI